MQADVSRGPVGHLWACTHRPGNAAGWGDRDDDTLHLCPVVESLPDAENVPWSARLTVDPGQRPGTFHTCPLSLWWRCGYVVKTAGWPRMALPTEERNHVQAHCALHGSHHVLYGAGAPCPATAFAHQAHDPAKSGRARN